VKTVESAAKASDNWEGTVTFIVEGMLGLMIVISIVALVARRLHVPYPILLVIGGLALAFVPGLPRPKLNPEMVFFIFLPPLLFPAALFTSWRDFRQNIRPIIMLAVGLVLFTMVIAGWLAHLLIPGLPLSAALLLGAIISPPDAIAATSIAHRLKLPKRLVTIIEGESLLNDSTALITYKFAVAAVVTGSFSWTHAVGDFFVAGVGGIAVGLIIALGMAWIENRLEDPPVETTLILLVPFAAYVLAESFSLSGVLSVVSSGFYLGWRSPEIVDARLRLQAGPVWEMLEFFLNGIVFLLIGLQLPPILESLKGYTTAQLLTYAVLINVAVIAIRIIWVFPAAYLARFAGHLSGSTSSNQPNWKKVAILAWTGMRGVVSLAAALALPLTIEGGDPFPARNLILFLTFSVIFGTLVIQGLSLPVLIRWLGVKDDGSTTREERAARIQANEAALKRLKTLSTRKDLDPEAVDRLRTEYEDRLRQLRNSEANGSESLVFSEVYKRLSFETLQAERNVILHLRNSRVIGDDVLREIQRDIDLAEARLRFPESGLGEDAGL
jgi:CPA1 family monovalent cation:H+ antiporter